MWYTIIAVFLIIGAIWGSKLIAGKHSESAEKAHNQIIPNSNPIENDTIKAMFSKEQINKKLKRLAESPIPKKLSEGAMCYEMAFKENTVHEYICPVCGEKTIYRKTKDKERFEYIDRYLDSDLNRCRREISMVKGINIKLDETEFCSHCKPKIEHPKLYLLVNIAGQKDTTRLSSFNDMDIRLIREFLNDGLVHKGDQDFETPLKENINRIKELLGI